MKKSKIMLLTVLALVLCIVCIVSNTFSWFPRPQELKGDSLAWNVSYDISVGEGITMATYESTDDGKTFGETALTDFTDTTGIASDKRRYFRTDIINSGDNAQSVSLFISRLDLSQNSNGNFYLGVNGPLKTYKGFGSSQSEKVSSVINKKNVYVGFNIHQTYVPTDYQIHWWDNSNKSYNSDSDVSQYLGKEGNYLNSTYKMAYATIPWDANSVKLRKNDEWYGVDNTNVDEYNTICLFLYDNATQAKATRSGTAAGINTYYTSASVTVGETINLAATGKGTITYKSSDESIATVSNDGTVKGVTSGSVEITATSTGVYGDTITETCYVTVNPDISDGINDVPIVTNLNVGARTEEGNTVVSVYWYIKNDGGTGNLNYTIDDVYLTL